MDTKTCSKCKLEQPTTEFWKDKHRPDGLRTACRTCTKNNPEYLKNYYQDRKASGKNKEYRDANIDRIRENSRQWHKNNPEKSKELRIRNQYARYGLTVEQYNAMMEFQGGLCAICEIPSDRSLQIDHDHACCSENSRSCGKCVRGLLCGNCNSMLGHINDNQKVLENGITYLRSRGLSQL